MKTVQHKQNNLENIDGKQAAMDLYSDPADYRQKLYEALPEEFTPSDALKKVKELDFSSEWLHSQSWIRSVIDSWLFDCRLERKERGLYRKIHTST